MIRLKSILRYEVKSMQKIKSKQGVTLVALAVSIVVMLILSGVSINIGVGSVNSTKDRNLQSELQMVQQVTITEYTKALELGYIKEGDTTTIPANFIGTRVDSISGITLSNGNKWYFQDNPSDAVGYKSYFRVTPTDLKKLNVLNTEHTYIINYYTGEVYNETKEKSSSGDDLFIKSNKSTVTEKDNDTTSFVD
jgi:type II secretory pathway pseudopilin PulG